MNRPLFEIGETVIRQAPNSNYPEANGEYVVVSIISAMDYSLKYQAKSINAPYYELKGLSINMEDFKGNKTGLISKHSCEIFLRKKHQPSEMNFNELMSSLNSPITTW